MNNKEKNNIDKNNAICLNNNQIKNVLMITKNIEPGKNELNLANIIDSEKENKNDLGKVI